MSSIIGNNESVLVYSQTTTLAPPLSIGYPPPTVQITSHMDGQEVPEGVLTIEGISSDDEESNCQVFADVNDNTPMRNVTASGSTGDPKDFSKWAFTYDENYQTINQGENELTTKITCFRDNNHVDVPISEWHTVNVTGVTTTASRNFVAPPSFSSPLPSVGDFDIEDGGDEDDGDEDDGDEDDGD
jgi:hypothetical protein